VRLEASTNGAEIARRLERRAQAFGSQLRGAQDRIRSEVGEESRRLLATRIYAKPIPRAGKSGRPQWTRSGALYRAERAEIRQGNVVLSNTAPHAKSRRDLGTPGGRPIRTPGVESVQWQEEALRNKLERIREFYREMNRRILAGQG
jgi:hypothetical protein